MKQEKRSKIETRRGRRTPLTPPHPFPFSFSLSSSFFLPLSSSLSLFSPTLLTPEAKRWGNIWPLFYFHSSSLSLPLESLPHSWHPSHSLFSLSLFLFSFCPLSLANGVKGEGGMKREKESEEDDHHFGHLHYSERDKKTKVMITTRRVLQLPSLNTHRNLNEEPDLCSQRPKISPSHSFFLSPFLPHTRTMNFLSLLFLSHIGSRTQVDGT